MAKRTLAAHRSAHGAPCRPAPAMPRTRSETASVAFRTIPVEGRHLLEVAEGVDCETARREASDLEDAVRRLLGGSIETGTDGSAAYLCEFALEAARALRQSTNN